MEDQLLGKNSKSKIIKFLSKKVNDFDLIILIDYGHGFVDRDIYNILEKKSKFLSINCQTNSANLGFNLITKYQRADFICIDEPELRLAMSNNKDEIKKIVTKQLIKKLIVKILLSLEAEKGPFLI